MYSIGRGKYLTNPKHFLFCIRLLTLYLLQKDISVMTRILEAKISYAENIVGYGKCAIEVDVCETWDRKLSYFLCFKFVYLYVHFFLFFSSSVRTTRNSILHDSSPVLLICLCKNLFVKKISLT